MRAPAPLPPSKVDLDISKFLRFREYLSSEESLKHCEKCVARSTADLIPRTVALQSKSLRFSNVKFQNSLKSPRQLVHRND
jgi:hypothetical protein